MKATINGLTVEMDDAWVTGHYDATQYAVYLSDEDGEIVSWTGDEWIEDPSVVASIVNAVLLGVTEGPLALREMIGAQA